MLGPVNKLLEYGGVADELVSKSQNITKDSHAGDTDDSSDGACGRNRLPAAACG
ncbi:hypothetical protein D3C81_2179330 [compost metagenome]